VTFGLIASGALVFGALAGGRLEIAKRVLAAMLAFAAGLPGAYPTVGRRTWRDTFRRSLEDQLPAVLAELAARLELAEKARLQGIAEEALRQERAAAARARATEAFLLDFRRAALRRQVQDWELARQLRGLLASRADDEAAAVPQWRAAAAAYADVLDPPCRRLQLPDDPAVSDSDLAP
jgi:hypothetical protein